MDRRREIIAAAIEGIAEGAFHPRSDPARESRTIFAIVDGFLMHCAMDPSFCPADQLEDRVCAVIVDRLCGPTRLA